MTVSEIISSGKTFLGIEFGSTRIKAVLTDEELNPIASGDHSWQNSYENGFWTYKQEEFIYGLKACYRSLSDNVKKDYNCEISSVLSIGISGMMHGYLAFDEKFNLLTPFRTWRNTTTSQAADILSETFNFNVPQRWSIAHLYQAVLNNESHIKNVKYITTLAGYIHYLLTGRFEVGIGEASGIFPVMGDDYNIEMLDSFNALLKEKSFEADIRSILPMVRKAGCKGAFLTDDGARLLDDSGKLRSGIPVCPPEGDAGTGMVATNSIRPNTGSISAGTSIFSMMVLDKPMKNYYKEIDVVMTPDGNDVAMIHCNNGCYELDEWVKLFAEFSKLCGLEISVSHLYNMLYTNSLNGNPDCSDIISYNFLASEPVVGVDNGKNMYFKEPTSVFNLANFFRSQIYSTIASLRIGANILFDNENLSLKSMLCHGGLFKVPGVAQQYTADAFEIPASVMSTAGEGGPWGMAILASYMFKEGSENGNNSCSLADYLDNYVFATAQCSTLNPTDEGMNGFKRYLEKYTNGLSTQRCF